MSEFLIDQREMARRKRAYTTLSLSVFLSATVCSIDYLVSEPLVAIPCVVSIGLTLLLTRYLTHRSTDRFGARRVVLSETSVANVSDATESDIGYADVRFMRVKKTVKGTIREIVLKTSDGTRFGLSGISDFDRLRTELTNRLGNDVKVSELREPIDFDHPWFYVFFGGLVGCSASGLFRLAPHLTYGTLRLFNIATSIFVLSVGIFWMLTRPGVATYGRRVLAVDITFGAILVCIGLLLGGHGLFAM